MGLTTSSTNYNNPISKIQAEYLPGIYDQATDLYNKGAPAYYPGQTVADIDPVRAQGFNQAVTAAGGPLQQLSDAQTNYLTGVIGGTDQATKDLAADAYAATRNTYSGAGLLGSTYQKKASEYAAARALNDARLNASQQVEQAQRNALRPAETLQNIGTQTQAYQQDLLNADRERYNYQATQPWQHLANYQNIVTNPSPSGYTQSISAKPSTANIIAGTAATLAGASGSFLDPRTWFRSAEGGEVPAWTGPVGSHEWQMVDGRYQLVPTAGGSQVGYGSVYNDYQPAFIQRPSVAAPQQKQSGGSNESGSNTAVHQQREKEPQERGTVTAGQDFRNPYTGPGAHLPDVGVARYLPEARSVAKDAEQTYVANTKGGPENVPGANWGGGLKNTADNETALIQSRQKDKEFWNAYEAGTTGDTSWKNDNNPDNDLGNAGWKFTSVKDVFDGGGPGASGDSYTGGFRGNTTSPKKKKKKEKEKSSSSSSKSSGAKKTFGQTKVGKWVNKTFKTKFKAQGGSVEMSPTWMQVKHMYCGGKV